MLGMQLVKLLGPWRFKQHWLGPMIWLIKRPFASTGGTLRLVELRPKQPGGQSLAA